MQKDTLDRLIELALIPKKRWTATPKIEDALLDEWNDLTTRVALYPLLEELKERRIRDQ